MACPHSNASPLPVVAFMKQIETITSAENTDDFLPAFVDRVMEIVLPSLLSKNRYVLQMGCNVLLQSQSDSTMSNSFELLMKRHGFIETLANFLCNENHKFTYFLRLPSQFWHYAL